jgi:hypothetical protein
MIRDKRFTIIIILFILFLPVRAQSYSTQQIELTERLDSLAKNAPSEIAYIQTSKDIYETGEDLWFKVYLLDAQYLNPSDLSKTLYLRLINDSSKKSVWQEKYEIKDGFANGQVYLDNDLPEGEYLIEVFTPNSFFNDTTEFYAVRRIKIQTDINSMTSEAAKTDKTLHDKKECKIQFTSFPEGGNLVSGVQSNLAFKAVNYNGDPVDAKGTLFQDSTPLLEFKSLHAGMGSFNFIPDADKKYFIRLTEPETDSTFQLPEVHPGGMSFHLSGRDEESLLFNVSQTTGLEPQDIYLRVQCRGVVYGLKTAILKRELRIKVPLSGLPQGIAEITLFNSRLEAVAERLVYINRDQKLNITTELSKDIYQTRGKATIKISVKDENGLPVVANLDVTVFDKLFQNPPDSNNILAHFYLSTQLKGRIYNPSYYFTKGNDREEALDLLMLTQGWRKYFWNEENLKKFSETPHQIIFDGTKGELFYPSQKKKIPKEQTFVIAFSPNRDSLNLLIPADSAGAFTVPEDRLKVWENDYVYLKPLGSYGSQPVYRISNPVYPEYDLHLKLTDPFEVINKQMKVNKIIYPIAGFSSKKEELPVLWLRDEIIEIPEVTIKGQKGNTLRGKFMRTLDSLTKYDLINDYVCSFNVLNCPRHKRDEFGTKKPIPGNWYYEIIAYNTPAEHVIYTVYQPPRMNEDELLKLNNLSRIKAYYGHREFYKPDYDKETEDSRVPDYRNTLLWEPSVITDEKGEATLSFFCSDINTDFVGRIEGAGGEGLLGSSYFKFTVRKLKTEP